MKAGLGGAAADFLIESGWLVERVSFSSSFQPPNSKFTIYNVGVKDWLHRLCIGIVQGGGGVDRRPQKRAPPLWDISISLIILFVLFRQLRRLRFSVLFAH